MHRFGVWIARVASIVVVVSANGCMYSFAGGGLPPHIRSMAIATFENQTASPDLPKELYDQMHRELQRRLGVRDAPSDRADALAHGSIQTYDADVPVSFSANPQQAVTARRHLAITIDVEIVDQSNGHVLYANKALREESDYAERAEADGRQKAIEKLVQRIIEGVQSNW
jgi:hypothetical protein